DSAPKKLLFASNGEGKAKWHIFAAAVDGSNVVKLSRGEALDFDPVWSPDGKKIAFVALMNEKDKKTDLYVMDPAGSTRKRMTTNRTGTVAWVPSWFPDGKRIVFTQTDAEAYLGPPEGQLFMVNADGTGLKRIAADGGVGLGKGNGMMPAVSPDG